MQQVKQCAGCGAQMGSRSRVCPRCGRGSLFGLLGQLFVLGVLLLAIGVVSGLIPLAPIQRAVSRTPVDTSAAVRRQRPPTPKAAARRPHAPRREAREAESVAAAVAVADSQVPGRAVARVLASAPCSGPDTEMIRRELEQPGRVDEARIAARACAHLAEHASDTLHTIHEPPPLHDSAAAWPADSPTAEPPAF